MYHLICQDMYVEGQEDGGGGGSRNYIHSFLFTYIVTATTTVGHIIEKIHAMKAQDYVNLAFHTKTTQFHLILT